MRGPGEDRAFFARFPVELTVGANKLYRPTGGIVFTAKASRVITES